MSYVYPGKPFVPTITPEEEVSVGIFLYDCIMLAWGSVPLIIVATCLFERLYAQAFIFSILILLVAAMYLPVRKLVIDTELDSLRREKGKVSNGR